MTRDEDVSRLVDQAFAAWEVAPMPGFEHRVSGAVRVESRGASDPAGHRRAARWDTYGAS